MPTGGATGSTCSTLLAGNSRSTTPRTGVAAALELLDNAQATADSTGELLDVET